MGSATNQNAGFQQNSGMMRNPGFNNNPYQPQFQQPMGQTQANGYPKYQFYGNPQYDNQMPWMSQFNSQGTPSPMMQSTMQNMGANSYNTPRPGVQQDQAARMAQQNQQPQQGWINGNTEFQSAAPQQQSWINGNTEFQSASPAVSKPAPNYAANPSPLGVDDIRARLFASTGGNVNPAATDFYRSQFMYNPDGSPYSVSSGMSGDAFYNTLK